MKQTSSRDEAGTIPERCLQAALLAKDALRREVMAMQSSLHDADLAKHAQQHMDSVSSSHHHSRHATSLVASPTLALTLTPL